MRTLITPALLTVLLTVRGPLFAQKVVEVTYEADIHGNISFSAFNKAFCNYTLQVDVTSLENGKSDHPLSWRTLVKPGSNKLFRLTRTSNNAALTFKYTASYRKGCLDPQVNPDFVYLLPISPGREAQAYEVQNITNRNAGDSLAARELLQPVPESKGGYAIRLKMKPGDTIYAARRGTVSGVEVGSSQNDAGQAETGSGNYIEIVHADCSFGRYGILKKNSALVHPGQVVEAGQPIGLVGGDQYGRGSEVRLSVSYNRQKEDADQGSATGNPAGSGSGASNSWVTYWVDIPLQFWTKRNGKGILKNGAMYTSEFPPAILRQELPKPASKGPAAKRSPKKHA